MCVGEKPSPFPDTQETRPAVAEMPPVAANFFSALRRVFRSFEQERREIPPEHIAKWEILARVYWDELDDLWIAECENLPGCMSQGDTEEEALSNLVDAIGGVITARMESGLHEHLAEHHSYDAGNGEHRVHKIALSV